MVRPSVSAIVSPPHIGHRTQEARVASKTRVERSKNSNRGVLEGWWWIGHEREEAAAVSVSGIGSDNAPSRDNAIFGDREDRMLTARSGPLGLGVPRTLGPAEGSDHLFLLPERALIMDSTHLRQDLAGLDFNLHLNLLHTAPRGNVWLCESLLCTESLSGDDGKHAVLTMRFFYRAKTEGGREDSGSMGLVYLVSRASFKGWNESARLWLKRVRLWQGRSIWPNTISFLLINYSAFQILMGNLLSSAQWIV